MIALRPASTWAASASCTSVAPASEKPVSRTYPTVPSARSWLMTSCSWTMSRVIARSNGSASPRWTVSVTTDPFGPRIRSRAPSTFKPSSEVPSVARIRSPASSPAFSAGDPTIGATTRSRQSAPSVVQPWVPSAACVAISAPMPSNWPLIPCRLSRYSSDVRYEEYGSPRASIMPRMAPWIRTSRSTSPPA